MLISSYARSCISYVKKFHLFLQTSNVSILVCDEPLNQALILKYYLLMVLDVSWVDDIFNAFHLIFVYVQSHFVLGLKSFLSCFAGKMFRHKTRETTKKAQKQDLQRHSTARPLINALQMMIVDEHPMHLKKSGNSDQVWNHD